MPIIKGSKFFEGSNLDNNAFSYFKPDVRQLIFSKKKNPDGLHLIFLPGYKEDNSGQGVWYKQIQVRDNFGVEFRKKYVVRDANNDPAAYFEKSFKLHYPEQAEPTTDDKGFKVYPYYGRTTTRVVFNVAILKELQKGSSLDKVVHVLDLPSYNGADQLTKWMNQPDSEGNPNPIVNDPESAVPVFVKLGTGLNPWSITPDASRRYEIPEAYGDSDNLYNLDNVFIEKSNEEILSDLRGMFSGQVFDICMEGFHGLTRVVIPGKSFSRDEEDNIDMAPVTFKKAGPVVTKIPSPSVTPALKQVPPLPEENEEEQEVVTEPVAPAKKMSTADLKSFLKTKR